MTDREFFNLLCRVKKRIRNTPHGMVKYSDVLDAAAYRGALTALETLCDEFRQSLKEKEKKNSDNID